MPREIKQKSSAVRAAGPIFDKQLGQHILKNPLVVNSIVEKVFLFPSFFLTIHFHLNSHLQGCIKIH